MAKQCDFHLFNPTLGQTYMNNGSEYLCIGLDRWGAAKMRNTATGWTLIAHGLWLYDSTGEIEWDYSTEGHFE